MVRFAFISVFILFIAFRVFADPTQILAQYDAGNYKQAAQLLDSLKSQDPVQYGLLPYALLHAQALEQLNDNDGAAQIYRQLTVDPILSRFAWLPLIKILNGQSKTQDAIAAYQSYLRHTNYPDYSSIALQAMDYCLDAKNAEALLNTAQIVENNYSTRRLAQYFIAKSYLLRKDNTLARSLLLSLIQATKADDISAQALLELDALDGEQLSESEKIIRGKLAYRVWDFDLTLKYLGPLVSKDIEYAYYYARALFFLDKNDESNKVFQTAIAAWPDSKWTSLCLYQYGNQCLRQGDYQKALDLFTQLKDSSAGEMLERATYREVQALRSQARLDEALTKLRPYTNSRKSAERARAIFLRGRIYFQAGKFREALTDFLNLSKTKIAKLNEREVLYWKAITLEKLGQKTEAQKQFTSLAQVSDFLGILAAERIYGEKGVAPPAVSAFYVTLPHLPQKEDEQQIIQLYRNNDPLCALLYLHLFDQAGKEFSAVSQESWRLMGVESRNRNQKYLTVAQFAALGKNYSTSTYYSDMFLRTLPKGLSPFSLPLEILKIIFPLPYKEEIEKFSGERKIDPLLVLSIMKQESKFKPAAKSPAFARGLMQLIPPTAEKLAPIVGITNFSLDQLYVPEININLGTKFLQDMIGRFGNNVEIIAAGYNSGEDNVNRWLDSTSSKEPIEFFSNIDLTETRNYVMLVRINYECYKRVYPGSPQSQQDMK
ncbi:MAG: hypothetical protein C5B54_04015 [Acidobacteria bacterium]|nr:MAG: hypothetical protein C5B54_04015 [Acidobacteriota bacterium]